MADWGLILGAIGSSVGICGFVVSIFGLRGNTKARRLAAFNHWKDGYLACLKDIFTAEDKHKASFTMQLLRRCELDCAHLLNPKNADKWVKDVIGETMEHFLEAWASDGNVCALFRKYVKPDECDDIRLFLHRRGKDEVMEKLFGEKSGEHC